MGALCVWGGGCVHACCSVVEVEVSGQLRKSWLSPEVWVVGMELGSLGLHTNALAR